MSQAWVSGRRRAVHVNNAVSRASRPLAIFRGRCSVDTSLGAPFPPMMISNEELARITREEPRRLCGHCVPTVGPV